MSKQGQRTRTLLGLLVVVGLLVLVDQFVLRGSEVDAEQSDAVGPRQSYLSSLDLLQRTQGIVSQAAAWGAALQEANETWVSLSDRFIEASTTQLAQAAFREHVLRVAREDFDLQALSARRTGAAPLLEDDESLQRIEITVVVESVRPEDVFRIVDRLEHMPDLATNIVSVDLVGPERMQTTQHVTGTIVIETIAWIDAGDQS
ncbi:MAG: hypothetical protein AAFX05_08095 [Planctomycetota bacterium]